MVTVVALAELLSGYSIGIVDGIGHLKLHLMTHFCFAYCSFTIVNASVSLLRVRMLREYFARDPAPLPDAVICQRYPVREMLNVLPIDAIVGK